MHRRDEGELSSLNFEGRVFCCWKCGSPTHIGDKCKDQARTFEEIFDEQGLVKPTWAAVVRSGSGDVEAHQKRVREVEERVTAANRKKAKELKDIEDRNRQLKEDMASREALNTEKRQKALREVEIAAAISTLAEKRVDWGTEVSDRELLEHDTQVPLSLPNDLLSSNSEVMQAGLRARRVASCHVKWLQERKHSVCPDVSNSPTTLAPIQISSLVPPELDLLFGSGASRLAIEYHHQNQLHHNVVANSNCMDVAGSMEDQLRDTSKTDCFEDGLKGRKRLKASQLSGNGELSSGPNNSESDSSSASGKSSLTSFESKKLRLEDESLWDEAVSTVTSEVAMKEDLSLESSGLGGVSSFSSSSPSGSRK